MKRRKVRLLALLILLLESAVGAYVFDRLANVCADVRGRLEFVDIEQHGTPKPVLSSNVRIIEHSNDTTVYINSKIRCYTQITTSGDYSGKNMAIYRSVKNLESPLNLIRDIYKQMSEMAICVLLVFLSILGFKKCAR